MKHLKVSADVRRKMREMQIHTRRLLSGTLMGDGRSAIRGSGFEFDQIREYHPGDDIRFIDWSASARSNELLVKEYIEERSRRVLLCVDISRSSLFGSGTSSKREFMAELGSMLALVADYGKDRIGLVLFSDEVEFYVPPGSGMPHVHVIMEHLFSYQPKRKKTSIEAMLRWLGHLKWRDAVICLISDFVDAGKDFTRLMSQVARRHDLVALRIFDQRERALPNVGFLTIEDSETGELVTVDTRPRAGVPLTDFFATRLHEQNRVFKRSGVDVIDLRIDQPFASELVKFFRRRMRY